MNAGRPPERMADSVQLALRDLQRALDGIDEAVRDVLERRTLGMQALGHELVGDD
jgi:hypothetical protein